MRTTLGMLALLIAVPACAAPAASLHAVRPPILGARSGGVAIGAFTAEGQGQAMADRLRSELEQALAVPGAGAVPPAAAGLKVTGHMEDFSVSLELQMKTRVCQDLPGETGHEVSVDQRNQIIETSCMFAWYEWRTQAALRLRVTDADGKTVFLRRIAARHEGHTPPERGVAGPAPSHGDLAAALRAALVDQMAQVVAPRREPVRAPLYECRPPAREVCAAGQQALLRADYEAAVREYAQAHDILSGAHAPNGSLARALWNRAVVLEHARRFAEAAADFAAAATLDPREDYRAALAEAQAQQQVQEQWIDPELEPRL